MCWSIHETAHGVHGKARTVLLDALVTVTQSLSYQSLSVQDLMRYFFSSGDVEPDVEDVPEMSAFKALGLDPNKEPEALKVVSNVPQRLGTVVKRSAARCGVCRSSFGWLEPIYVRRLIVATIRHARFKASGREDVNSRQMQASR